MSPILVLLLFTLVAGITTLWVAGQDLLIAGFMLFFYIYVIIALVGYQFYPVVSIALGLYLGPDVFTQAVTFVSLSFVAFAVAFRIGHRRFARPGWQTAVIGVSR